jgi:hypothetical protein
MTICWSRAVSTSAPPLLEPASHRRGALSAKPPTNGRGPEDSVLGGSGVGSRGFEAEGVPETSEGPQASDRLSDEVASTVGANAISTSVMTDPR